MSEFANEANETTSSTDAQEPEKVQMQKEVKDELNALLKRDVFVRRGRNNRIYQKFIMRDIFEDLSDQDKEDLSF